MNNDVRNAARNHARELGRLREENKAMRERIVAFVRASDARADGTGDFDVYHSARHDLVMAIGGDLDD